jgi:putative ABC transport system substrate-binding protein
VVYSSDLNASFVKETKTAASKTGLTLVERSVGDDAQVPNAIRELKGQIDGLYLPPDRIVAKHDAFQFIALFTFENNLPFMAPTDRFVKKGALVALMIDFEEVGKQAGQMAKKAAGGTLPPPEPPEVTILVLNQKTAQTIGINIPPALLQGSMIIK